LYELVQEAVPQGESSAARQATNALWDHGVAV
jgi:hypothetical protein